MPIKPYLAGRTFAPETVAAMGTAFAEACKSLNIAADNPSRSMLAQTIISVAERGTTDPDQLAARAVREMMQHRKSRGPHAVWPNVCANLRASRGCTGADLSEVEKTPASRATSLRVQPASTLTASERHAVASGRHRRSRACWRTSADIVMASMVRGMSRGVAGRADR
jgi:hypothetical protein